MHFSPFLGAKVDLEPVSSTLPPLRLRSLCSFSRYSTYMVYQHADTSIRGLNASAARSHRHREGPEVRKPVARVADVEDQLSLPESAMLITALCTLALSLMISLQ